MKIPFWMYLGWLRIYAQYECGRCSRCDRCRAIADLETPPVGRNHLDLAPYQGQWVVVVGNRKIVDNFKNLGDLTKKVDKYAFRESCSMFYVARPEEVMLWSVQYPSRPGYVFPNCFFSTRERAEAWIHSWKFTKKEGDEGAVFTRAGQFEPWTPA